MVCKPRSTRGHEATRGRARHRRRLDAPIVGYLGRRSTGGRHDASRFASRSCKVEHGSSSAQIETQSRRPGRRDGMAKPRSTIRRSARAFAMLMSASLVAVSMTAAAAVTRASASTPTFQAVGSAKQVYVTGLAPFAEMSLVTAAGQTVSTQSADSLGGLLFRNVTPAIGYRVRQV